MAKKPAPPKADTKLKPSEMMSMPPSKVIVSLAKRKKAAKTEMSEISGSIGEAVAKEVEKNHVDRKALSIACTLNSMSDKKLAVTYYHLLRYMDDLGIQERADKQGDMFQEEGTEDDKEDAAAGDTNVHPIGAAARRVAEAAGAKE